MSIVSHCYLSPTVYMLWGKNEPLYCERLRLSYHFSVSAGCLMVTNSCLTYQQQQRSLSHDAHQSTSQSHFTFWSLRNLIIFILIIHTFKKKMEYRACLVLTFNLWPVQRSIFKYDCCSVSIHSVVVSFNHIQIWYFTILVHLFA